MKKISYLLGVFFFALTFTMCSDDEKGETVEMMKTRTFVLPEGYRWSSDLDDRGLYTIDNMKEWNEMVVAEEGASALPDIDFEKETLVLVVIETPKTGYYTTYGLYKFGDNVCIVDIKMKDSETQTPNPDVVVASFVSETKIAKKITYNTFFTLPFD